MADAACDASSTAVLASCRSTFVVSVLPHTRSKFSLGTQFATDVTTPCILLRCSGCRLPAAGDTYAQAALAENMLPPVHVPGCIFQSIEWEETVLGPFLCTLSALQYLVCQQFGALAPFFCLFVTHCAHHRIKQQRWEKLLALANEQRIEELSDKYSVG